MLQQPIGLAEQQAAQQAQMEQAQGQAPQGINPQMVSQVAEMLAQGMSPEELMQRGVPQEVIEMAIAMLQEQSTQIPPEEAGLAGMVTQQGM